MTTDLCNWRKITIRNVIAKRQKTEDSGENESYGQSLFDIVIDESIESYLASPLITNWSVTTWPNVSEN